MGTHIGHARETHLCCPLQPGLAPAGCLLRRYSEEFERTFMEHLKRAHPFSRIAANVVYNEYINDRQAGPGRGAGEGRGAQASGVACRWAPGCSAASSN